MAPLPETGYGDHPAAFYRSGSLQFKKSYARLWGESSLFTGSNALKIMYVAAEPRQTVHSAHFDLPFSLFLLLRDEHLDVTEVSTLIEDISVLSVDCRRLTVSTLLFTYASKKSRSFAPATKKPLPPSHSCHPKVQHFNCGHTPVKGTCLVCGEHKKENAHNALYTTANNAGKEIAMSSDPKYSTQSAFYTESCPCLKTGCGFSASGHFHPVY